MTTNNDQPKLGDAIIAAVEKSDQAATLLAEKVTHGAKKTIIFIGVGVAAIAGIGVFIYKRFKKR